MNVLQLADARPGTAILTENLDFYYGGFHALKKITLEFQKNEVTALIGPSGCGKSTFLRTINRMNDLIPSARTEGELTVFGENILAPSYDVSALRRRVGMVSQQPNPFPVSIYDNIAYGPRLHGAPSKRELDERVESCLRAAVLWDEVKDDLKKPALGLSGGQQQRLVIARVLAAEPEIILMDEPTSALDPISTMKLEELISALKREYTIIIVTHNMQQAARVSGETAFFYQGEVVESGATDKIFASPVKKQTEDYITGRFG